MSFKKRSSLPSADDFDKKSNRSWSAKSSSSSKKSKKKEEKDNTPKVSLRQLFRYATPVELLMLFVGTAISLCVGSALPVMSILQGNVSDYFIKAQICWDYENNSNVTGFLCDKEEFKHKVMNVVYGYAGMAVAVFIAANIQITFFLIICEKINNRLRRKFVQSILRQDIPWFDTNNSGALATKLFDNLERVREGTGDKIGLMFQAIGQFFAGFIVAFFHSWELTLVMLAMVPLMAACGFAISRAMTVFTLRESKKYAKAGAVVEQTISSIRTVVALNGLDHEIDRYGDAIAEARHAGILKNLYMGISFGMLGVVQFTSFALAFYVGVGWVADGKMEINDLMTTFFSVLMGSLALGQAGPQLAVVGAAQGAAASIYEVLDREPEIDSTSKNGRTDMKIKGNIELKNVVFNYPSRPDVQILKSLSLNVTAGETVALVGSSGCGKSTVVSLLLRYYNVLGGMISIDGVPIEDINIEFLRNQIAVVSQEPILFNCTIEENIKFGREDITHEEMRHACRLANADNFISALPQAYHTLVGDRGTQLSGGQKQRIAIARALVRDPKILLLDEATSALDAESEGIVQKALETASRGRTTLIIAHRLSTIKNAHKIIALKGGEVVEWGTHDELLEKKGLYFDLVNAQTFTDAIDGQVITEEEGLPRQTSKTARQTSRQMSRELSRLDSSRVSIRSATEAGLRLRAATGMSVAEVGDEPLLEMPGRQKKDDMSRLKQELKDEGVQRTNLFRIIMASRKNWNTMFIGFLFSLVGGLVFPTYSVLFSQIMQSFATIDNDDLKSTGHFWALMFLVLAVVQGTQSFGQVFFMGWGAEGLAMDLRDRLFRNILSMDMGYFDSPLHACGKICTRLASDVPNLRSAMDFRLTTVLTTLVSICAGVGLAFYYGWQMACLVVGILPIVGFGQALRVRVMTGKHRKGAKDFEDSGKVAMEAISNVRTVQALTREEEFYSKFCRHLDGPHREALRESFMQGVSYGFAACVIFILNFASYWLGLHLILEKTMSPMHVLRVMYAVSISASTLGFATSYFPEYMKARLAGGIIFSMLGEQTKIDNLSKAGERPTLTGEVVFKNVKFAYPERPQIEVLKGLNFNVKPGHTLALVGPSGCGKSTVVSLIERFYDPLDGQVLLDGHDLRSLNPLHTRSQIAIVSQEPILFDCSIAENIVYGMEGDVPSKEEIEEAARKANIHIFIESLPDSYGTRVGDKGTQLSGGQKQRIAIARALVRKPKILLLDEATSALDTESEKIVQEALDRAREGRTCIVIAHRLSTVVNADSIAVVKGGLIVEQGNHTELMAHKGVYYELTQKQTVRTTPQ